MAYVTAAEILTHAGVTSPTAGDTEWAQDVAAAIEAEIAFGMLDVTVDPGSDTEAAIRAAALTDAAAAYVSRKAPHGILSVGPDGEAVRLGSDIVRALRPVFRRYGTAGIA